MARLVSSRRLLHEYPFLKCGALGGSFQHRCLLSKGTLSGAEGSGCGQVLELRIALLQML